MNSSKDSNKTPVMEGISLSSPGATIVKDDKTTTNEATEIAKNIMDWIFEKTVTSKASSETSEIVNGVINEILDKVTKSKPCFPRIVQSISIGQADFQSIKNGSVISTGQTSDCQLIVHMQNKVKTVTVSSIKPQSPVEKILSRKRPILPKYHGVVIKKICRCANGCLTCAPSISNPSPTKIATPVNNTSPRNVALKSTSNKREVARKRTGNGKPETVSKSTTPVLFHRLIKKPAVNGAPQVDQVITTAVSSPMLCSLCQPNKMFLKRINLIMHLKTDHGSELGISVTEKPCPACGKQFANEKLLIMHLKVCKVKAEKKLIKCVQCNRRFTSQTAYNIHAQNHRPGELKCQKCNKKFQTGSELIDHLLKHNLRFDQELKAIAMGLGNGISVSSRLTPSFYKCSTCFRVFTIAVVYQRHLRLTERAKKLTDPKQCPMCEFQDACVCRMGVHIESHKFETESICKKCGQKFRTANGLVRHELEHEGKLNAVCKLCGGYFRSVSHLETHARRCVNEKQSFECKECKRVFASRWRLREHSHSHQPNVYFCDQCGRQFKHLLNLNRHVNSKCGTQPWIFCDFCNEGFFNRKSLAAHLRDKHTTETMFICQYCSGEFLTRVQLKRHEARHERKK